MIYLPHLSVFVVCILILVHARMGILAALLLRPIIDMCWETDFFLLGFPPTHLQGVLFPTVVFIKLLMAEKSAFFGVPLAFPWIFYGYYQAFNTMMIMTSDGGILDGLNFFFRAFTGFVSYYVFQVFFSEREDFKLLLLVLLASAIIPLSTAAYQNFFGGMLRTENTIGGMVRNVGLYHDAFTLRLYSFQTVTAGLLYWAYFITGPSLLSRASVGSVMVASALTIYFLYSKAGYLIAGIWLFVWPMARRNFVMLALTISIGLGAIVVAAPSFLDKVSTVYTNEYSALTGKEKLNRTLAGRWTGWRIAVNEWINSPVYLQLVGNGELNTSAHNDFLRVLLANGIVGLLIYVGLLSAFGVKIIVMNAVSPNALNASALMLWLMWLVDAMGLVPGAYPGYQLYVWGFIGLAFSGVKGWSGDPITTKRERALTCIEPATAPQSSIRSWSSY